MMDGLKLDGYPEFWTTGYAVTAIILGVVGVIFLVVAFALRHGDVPGWVKATSGTGFVLIVVSGCLMVANGQVLERNWVALSASAVMSEYGLPETGEVASGVVESFLTPGEPVEFNAGDNEKLVAYQGMFNQETFVYTLMVDEGSGFEPVPVR